MLWINDQTLYSVLPGAHDDREALPPRDEFLGNCARYWEQRQHPDQRRETSDLARRLRFALGRALGLV